MNKEKNISDSDLVWEEIKTKHIIQNEWIDFRESAYRFPDGTVFEPYYSYSRRDYVVVVATDENDDYICVRQFRQGIKQVTNEFVAGGIERCDGKEYGSDRTETSAENALEAAKRELREETGFTSDDLELLVSIKTTVAFCNEKIDIYVARNLKPGEQDLDEDEFVEYQAYEIDELIRRIYACEIQDSKTICAILAYKEKYINR